MLNRIALGTVQFGMNYGIANRQGQVSLDEAKAILNYAQIHGINTLDTAITYGESEQRLGEIGILDWQVISKLPAIPENCYDVSAWIQNSINESLQRLRLESLYGLLLHRPKQLLEQNGDQLYQSLQRLKLNGLVNKIGISIYEPDELDMIFDRYSLDIVQAPFNIFDRRLIDTGWISRLTKQGIELHVRSVFLQGLLLMNKWNRPEKFNRWRALWDTWDVWLNEQMLSPLQACLRYVLSYKEIDKIILGVDSMRQLKEILQVAQGPALAVPDSLECGDLDLINPSRWEHI